MQYGRRFARREAGKRVKGYSATDLAAILGGGASEAETKAAAVAAAKAAVPPAQPAEQPVSSSGELLEGRECLFDAIDQVSRQEEWGYRGSTFCCAV